MTREEDIWQCFNCGETQGRHDLWFEGDICEACFSKLNYAIINYNEKTLTLFFKGQEFEFDLTEGDIGEFWYGFETNDGEVYDVNYGEEEGEDNASVIVYCTTEEDDTFFIDTNNYFDIEIKGMIGNASDYFNYKNV